MTHHQIAAALAGRFSNSLPRQPVTLPDRLLLSATESAGLLGMSLRKFHQTRPELPDPVVIGARHVRWRRADLVAWVESLTGVAERSEPSQLAAGKVKKRAEHGGKRGHAGGTEVQVAEHQQPRGPKQRIPPSNSKLDLSGQVASNSRGVSL